MCQEGSMFVSQAKINWCSTYVDRIRTKLTSNHQRRPTIPQSVFSKNTAMAFCLLLGDEQKMMKTSEREYVKQLQQNWRHFFGADTSREINKFSFLPREITCTWLVSVVFIKAVAPKASEPPIRKINKLIKVRRHKEKAPGCSVWAETTDYPDWCRIISKQLREVCVQADEGKRQLGRQGVGNSIWL